MSGAALWVLFTTGCVAAAWVMLRRDPRWLGNAALVALSALGVLGVLLALKTTGIIGVALFFGIIASPLLALLLIGLLGWNGVEVIRREGFGLAHALPLLLGAGLLAVMVGCVVTIVSRSNYLFDAALWIVLLIGWFGGLLIGYVGYSWLYNAIARRRRPDYVVTLGSGLIGDRVTPLLARRIDAGLALYRQGRAAGRTPLLVMSGGQGNDETVAEGRAMANYAVAQGIDPDHIIVEDRSATTQQNLKYSAELVAADPRLGPDARGVAVTSNYHALRAAVLARSLGLPVDAVGATVAWYFWPSAMLREFVAIIRPHWKLHALVALLVTLPMPLLVLWSQLG